MSTSIIKAVQTRVGRLHRSDFMKGSWHDERKKEKGMSERVAHENWTREGMWCDRGRVERSNGERSGAELWVDG